MAEEQLEALRRLIRDAAMHFAERADSCRDNTRSYDGSGWDMMADAYDSAGEYLLDQLRALTGGTDD